MTILTQWGQADIIGPGEMADGSPGVCVLIRRSTCPTYPWAKKEDGTDAGGTFAFAIVPANNAEPNLQKETDGTR